MIVPRGREILPSLGLALAALLLWHTPLVLPFKLFVVMLHELSHGIAAILTGGRIIAIQLTVDQGGLCQTAGGSRPIILSAGYLGSMVWGALLLVLGSRSRRDRAILGALGTLVVGITALYVRSLFGAVFGILTGAALVLCARYLPASVSDLLLRAIGVTSCLYAPEDIASDLILRSVPDSDAAQLARVTFIPGVAWGILWMVASLAVAAIALWVSATGPRAESASLPGGGDSRGTCA